MDSIDVTWATQKACLVTECTASSDLDGWSLSGAPRALLRQVQPGGDKLSLPGGSGESDHDMPCWGRMSAALTPATATGFFIASRRNGSPSS